MTTETSIYEYAKQGLALSADKPAIWFYGKSITYRELFEKIDNVADHLYALGVREGTVVTIHLPNCPQAVMAIYAVAKLGGICNMVHPLTPETALRENMAFTESAFLVTHLDVQINPLTLCVDVSHHMGDSFRKDYLFKNGGRFKGFCFEEYEELCTLKVDSTDQRGLSERCAVYLHSSGSTGNPKTVMLSHSALNNCSENTADFFEHGDMRKQVSLGVLPLFHGFGLVADVHRNIRFGATLVMMARWNAKQAVTLIKWHRVTLIVGVPTIFYALLNEPEFSGKEISQLRYCYTGGDNVSPELVRRMDERTGNVRCMFPGFGLTEATTMNCVSTFCHYKPGSAGYPVRNTTISVLHTDGTLSPTGEGELVISSPTLMLGYYRDRAETERTLFQSDGKLWTRTGDEVFIDEDGFLFFKDRIKNIIIHNGYNIYPGQVEGVIRTVDGVCAVCVVGVRDPALCTQNIRAVVIPSKDSDQEELRAAIRAKCLERLPRYSIPKEIRFVESFPQNDMGKINRKELSKV